ncbi:hypothetical protein EV360DRAFT_77917 [Lentinula raphanica]|nr:hypothetical protein EV360DRAFT_77917 [Lentinula raphanica]
MEGFYVPQSSKRRLDLDGVYSFSVNSGGFGQLVAEYSCKTHFKFPLGDASLSEDVFINFIDVDPSMLTTIWLAPPSSSQLQATLASPRFILSRYDNSDPSPISSSLAELKGRDTPCQDFIYLGQRTPPYGLLVPELHVRPLWSAASGHVASAPKCLTTLKVSEAQSSADSSHGDDSKLAMLIRLIGPARIFFQQDQEIDFFQLSDGRSAKMANIDCSIWSTITFKPSGEHAKGFEVSGEPADVLMIIHFDQTVNDSRRVRVAQVHTPYLYCGEGGHLAAHPSCFVGFHTGPKSGPYINFYYDTALLFKTNGNDGIHIDHAPALVPPNTGESGSLPDSNTPRVNSLPPVILPEDSISVAGDSDSTQDEVDTDFDLYSETLLGTGTRLGLLAPANDDLTNVLRFPPPTASNHPAQASYISPRRRFSSYCHVHLPKPDPHRPPSDSDSQHDSESHLLSHNPQPSLAADDDAHSTQSEYYYGDQDEDHQDDRNPLKHRMIEVQFLATIKVNSKPKPKPNFNGSNPTNSSSSSSFHYRLQPNFMPRLMLDEAVLEYLQFRKEEKEKKEEKEEKEKEKEEKKEKEKEEEKEEEKEKQEKPKEAVFTHAMRDNILIPTVNMRMDFSKMKKPPPLLGDHDNNGDNWWQRMIIFPYPDPRAPCAFNWRLRGETEWVRGYHLPDWRPNPKMTKQPPLRKGVPAKEVTAEEEARILKSEKKRRQRMNRKEKSANGKYKRPPRPSRQNERQGTAGGQSSSPEVILLALSSAMPTDWMIVDALTF